MLTGWQASTLALKRAPVVGAVKVRCAGLSWSVGSRDRNCWEQYPQLEVCSVRTAQPVVRILKRNRTRRCASVKICIPQQPVPFGLPRKQHYTTKEVATVLGISPD